MRVGILSFWLMVAAFCGAAFGQNLPTRLRDGPLCQPGQDPSNCLRRDDKNRLPYGAEIYRPVPGKLIYQPARTICNVCVSPWRQFIFAFAVEIRDDQTKSFNAVLTSKASQDIRSTFGPSVAKALTSYADTTSVGWIDQPDVICRARRKKPSLVLAAPYFEDVEYCLRLITEDSSRVMPTPADYGDVPMAPSIFRIQSEIVVAVTKNPSSPYRQPTTDEETPFGEVIVKLADTAKTLIADDIKSRGWQLKNVTDFGAVYITGLNNGAADVKSR